MAESTAREQKLIQYLNEAYGKEKQLETMLQAQIKLADKPPLKKRLKEHLQETKAQARGLSKRIKELGGKAEVVEMPGPDMAGDAASAVASLANKALAAAKGPMQALRGTSAPDNQLRNVRDAIWNEAEEIAHYDTVEAFADQLGDKETVRMAKEFRRQEERMEAFLRKQIPSLVRDVIKSEVPASERKPDGASATRRTTRSRSASTRSTSSRARSTSRSGSSGSDGASRSRSTSGTGRSRSTSGSGGSRSSSGSSGSSSGSSGSRSSSGTSGSRSSSGTSRSRSSS
jgi:ferritin-like metal-binding protein YciE